MLALLLACAGDPDDTGTHMSHTTPTATETCDPGHGSVHPCVTDVAGGVEQVGVPVYFEPVEGGEVIQGRTGDDGCVRLSLATGEWRVWATDLYGFCESKPYSAVVEECGFDHFELHNQDLCVGR